MPFVLKPSEALAIAAGSFALWRAARPYIMKSALADVPGPTGGSRIAGHMQQLYGKGAWEFHESLAGYGGVVKVQGLFGEEQLYVSDPVALHHIVLKEQDSFEEDSILLAFVPKVWGLSFSGTSGDHHKKQRKMLNPVFSLKHIRGLVPIFYPIVYQVRDVFTKEITHGTGVIDVFNWMSLAALEFISQGGLGHSFDALNPIKRNKYNDYIKSAVSTMTTLYPVIALLPYIGNIGPASFRRKVIDWTPSTAVHRLRDISDVMQATSEEIYHQKKEALSRGEDALMSQVANGKDIMTILLKANSEAKEGDKLPEDELLAQMNALIFAGQDTTSNAMSRTLHLLAVHQDIQVRLREEIVHAREENGGLDLDYELLMALPFLDAVCRETLRVFPPKAMVWRETVKDTVLPLQTPVKSADGKGNISSIPLKKGSHILISILNANRSKDIWGQDASEWKPNRWLQPLPDSVSKARLPGVFSSMMTFLGGGRSCMGLKFAELEMKMLLFVLVETFMFSLDEEKEIEWTLKILQQPSVVGGEMEDGEPKSQLPLKLSFVDGSKSL